MHTRRVFALVLGITTPCHAAAQQGELTPEVSQSLLVEVQTSTINSQGKLEPALPASGTIVGLRRDTLYVVTALHHVEIDKSDHKLVDRVEVRLRPDGPLLPAQVTLAIIDIDIAVLAIPNFEAEESWNLPGTVPRPSNSYSPGERVFAFGCPEGECWTTPEEGVLWSYANSRYVFRSYYLKPGMSGGPLVDADGAVLGVIVSTDVSEGKAAWWRHIEEVLRHYGYPLNLPTLQGYRVGAFFVRTMGAVFPVSGLNSDGRHLQPGWRVEMSRRVAPRTEIAAGFNRLSFAASPFDDREADYEEAYAHTYFYGGIRYSLPLTRWSISSQLPDVVSAGVDVLYPLKHDTRVVGMTPSDSVDIARGEYVLVRSIIRSRAGLSFAARGSYRIALSDRMGVFIAPSLYLVNFEYLLSSPFRGTIEVGGDLQLGGR